MFITTSKKTNIFEKRFSKYLSTYLPEIKYIPRGKTSLKKIYEKATYLGHDFFLKVSSQSEKITLSIYFFKEGSFFLDREYLLEVLDLRCFKNLSYIKKINDSVNDEKKVFYFLPSKNISKPSKYGVFEKEENVFEFLEDGFYLGFSFKILNVKKFD